MDIRPRTVLSFDMGSRNLAFALVEAPDTIVRLGVIDLGKHAARQATDALVNTLMDPLGNSWMANGEHELVVELQPGSGVCKTLSHVLQTFFAIVDRQCGREPRTVRFMHAGNKLRYDPALMSRLNPSAHTLTYADRKECAVQMALMILSRQSQTKYADFFSALDYKRQTDVADALVQACRHLQE